MKIISFLRNLIHHNTPNRDKLVPLIYTIDLNDLYFIMEKYEIYLQNDYNCNINPVIYEPFQPFIQCQETFINKCNILLKCILTLVNSHILITLTLGCLYKLKSRPRIAIK